MLKIRTRMGSCMSPTVVKTLLDFDMHAQTILFVHITEASNM